MTSWSNFRPCVPAAAIDESPLLHPEWRREAITPRSATIPEGEVKVEDD